MQKIIEELESFCEGTKSYWGKKMRDDDKKIRQSKKSFEGVIGVFGGQDHFWPGKKGGLIPDKNWSLYHAGEGDTFGSSDKVGYQYDGPEDMRIFVDFDANSWVGSEGKKPIKYKMEAYDKDKTGTVKSPDKIVSVLKDAEKFAKKIKDSIAGKAPERKGWDLTQDYEWVYFYDLANKYETSFFVKVEDEVDSLDYSGGEGVATIELDSDYDDEKKTVKIKNPLDINKALDIAENMWKNSKVFKRGL